VKSEEETDKVNEQRSRVAHAKEAVIRHTLSVASHHFAEPAEDHGWERELRDDLLQDAMVEWYTQMQQLNAMLAAAKTKRSAPQEWR